MGMSQLLNELNGLKNYFSGKKTEIETAVAAAQAAVLANQKAFWVNPLTGSDTNSGTEAAPFATIRKAVDSVPLGGRGTINLAEVAELEFMLTSNITLVNKWIMIQTSIAAANKAAMPIIRQGHYVDSAGKHNVYGFLLLQSTLVISSVNLETTALPAGDIGNGEGLIKRQDFVSGAAFVIGSRITVRDTAFARRPLGPGVVKVCIYNVEIQEAGALRQAKFIEADNLPFEFQAGNTVLPAGRTWNDLIGGIARYTNGIPRNMISNIDFSTTV